MKWHTMREALARLWHRRSKGSLVLIAGDVLLVGTASLAFLLLPPTLSILLATDIRSGWRLLLAAALAVVGGSVGLRIWRRSWPFLVETAWLLVAAAATKDLVDAAQLTRVERTAVARLRDGLRALSSEIKAASRSRHELQAARDRWRSVHNAEVGALSRSDRVLNRLALPEKILTDALVQDEDADVFTAVVRRVSEETADVLNGMLSGRPATDSASMWPYSYAIGRSKDFRKHAGKPESLRTWLKDQAAEDHVSERDT